MQDSILLKAIRGEKTSYPPVWFMRQAGRVLPSYLELRNKYSFWQMMKDPVLAAKVTLLPVNDLDVDAAILFSDILVIPYAMGMGLDFSDHGPVFEKPLKNYSDPVLNLKPEPDKLNYIYASIDEIIKTRRADTPLIGFAGAPFTVLCYMLEGLSSKTGFSDAVSFFYNDKAKTGKLIDSVTELTIEYARQQIAHGIDVFQLFETHGGLIPFDFYRTEFLPSVKKIACAVRDMGVPFIYFPKDIGTGLKHITPDVCDFVSIDWQTSIVDARALVHRDVGLQGNLDPRLLFTREEVIEKEIRKYLEFGKEEYKWIFNLGHGFLPGSSFENAKFIVNKVKTMNWGREIEL
jgi:uroporphyrinogen decarboxylase